MPRRQARLSPSTSSVLQTAGRCSLPSERFQHFAGRFVEGGEDLAEIGRYAAFQPLLVPPGLPPRLHLLGHPIEGVRKNSYGRLSVADHFLYCGGERG
jgi:hypothetical protein